MLGIAQSNTDRLIRLINDILDIEKIESGRFELSVSKVDLAELALTAVAELRAVAGEGRVRLEVADSRPVHVSGDRDRLLQVLTNLIGNAIKFSPPGGRVSIVVDGERPELARVEVVDEGPGIPEESAERVFERFAQLDSADSRRFGGTGLGLAISKAIVEQHRGTIGFASAAGEGTRFHFDLPRRRTHEEIDALRIVSARPSMMLLVEADPNLAQILCALAESLDFEVKVAGSLAAASLALADWPEVLVVGATLPDGSGGAWLEGEGARALPAVYVVDPAEPMPERSGVCVRLVKPFGNDDFVRALRAAAREDAPPRVLLVEDDADTRGVLVEQLADLGCDVAGTGLGAEAIEAASARPPDLVILDVALPDMDGYQVVEALRGSCRHVPLVVYSAFDLGHADRVRLRLGPTRHLVKSRVAPVELVATVRDLLFGRAASTPPPGR